MSTVNFNDTTPTAPASIGVVNVKFQSDASGNISGYTPIGTYSTWTPTLTPGTPMTASSVSFTHAYYIQIGPVIHFSFSVTATYGGTATNLVQVTAPIATDTETHACAGLIFVTSSSLFIPNAAFVSGGTITIYMTSGNYATATPTFVRVSGTYRVSGM